MTNKLSNLKLYHTPIHLLAFLVISMLYFNVELNNYTISYNYYPVQDKVMDYKHETSYLGKEISPRSWNNTVYSGVPNYAIDGIDNPWVKYVNRLISFGFQNHISLLFLLMTCFYFMMLGFGFGGTISFVTSIAYAFTPTHFMLLASGEYEKLQFLTYLPLIIVGLHKIFTGNRMGGAVFYIIGILFCGLYFDYQFCYYGIIMGLVYMLCQQTIKFDVNQIAWVLICTVIAVTPNLIKFWCYFDFAVDAYGTTELITTPSRSWENLKEVSMGYGDVLAALFNPGINGTGVLYGSTGLFTELGVMQWSNIYDLSGSPTIYGIVGIIFMIYLVFHKSNLAYERWVKVMFVIVLLTTLGYNFWPNKILFYYLPGYNYIDQPYMAVCFLPIIMFPVVFRYIRVMVRNFKVSWVPFYKNYSYLLLMILLASLLLPIIFGFDSSYHKFDGNIMDRLLVGRKLLLSLLTGMLLLSSVLVFLVNKFITNHTLAIVLMTAAISLPYLPITYNSYNNSDFADTSEYGIIFRPNDKYYEAMDKYGYYRVHDAHDNFMADSEASAWLYSMGGGLIRPTNKYANFIGLYGPEKSGIGYQLLNVKYKLHRDKKTGDPVVSDNPTFGPAWFCDSIITVSDDEEELILLSKTTNRIAVVSVDQDLPPVYRSKILPSVDLAKVGKNNMIYYVKTDTQRLLVLPEIYNKHWQAHINDQPVNVYEVNYLLRGVVIPSGSYKLKLTFNPDIRTIMIVSKLSVIVLVIFIVLIIIAIINNKKHMYDYE